MRHAYDDDDDDAATRHGTAEREDEEDSERFLLGARPRDGRGHGAMAGRAQRMAENGEALRYIELVLRQLQRASRDHRRLVQQRHTDFRYDIGGVGSVSRFERLDERLGGYGDGRENPTDTYKSRCRSSSDPWESEATSSKPDVTTRLLTKRRDYGGTAQSAALRSAPRRVQDGLTAAAYQGSRYVAEDDGWKSAREAFGAWSLSETPSDSDKRTSSTVV